MQAQHVSGCEGALAHILQALPTDVLVDAGLPASAALLLLVSRAVRSALSSRVSPLPVTFYPSALTELSRHYPHITSLKLSQETENAAYAATMSNIAAALPFLGSLRSLDLSALREQEAIERPAFDVSAFYASLEKHCPRLAHVVLGQLAMDADSDTDDNFNHDTVYVSWWIEGDLLTRKTKKMQPGVLETISFADMFLHEDDASLILQACLATPSMRSLSLSDNAMYSLRLITKNLLITDAATLATLDLSCNCLGSGHDDSDALTSAEYFADLVADFPSLRTLDLSHNRIIDAEGEAIARAVYRHRHLTALDLSHNCMNAETQDDIRTAWAGPALGLVL
jgi:hypothetical protein